MKSHEERDLQTLVIRAEHGFSKENSLHDRVLNQITERTFSELRGKANLEISPDLYSCSRNACQKIV